MYLNIKQILKKSFTVIAIKLLNEDFGNIDLDSISDLHKIKRKYTADIIKYTAWLTQR